MLLNGLLLLELIIKSFPFCCSNAKLATIAYAEEIPFILGDRGTLPIIGERDCSEEKPPMIDYSVFIFLLGF